MPFLLIGLAVIALCLYFFVKAGKKGGFERWQSPAVFGLGLLCLIISVKLFWNMGVFADEYGSSPVLVTGGWFWLYMDWLRMGLLLALCVISGARLWKE